MSKVRICVTWDERWPDYTWQDDPEDFAHVDPSSFWMREVSPETIARWTATRNAYDDMQAEILELCEAKKMELQYLHDHWMTTGYRPPEGSPKREAFDAWLADGKQMRKGE